MNKKYFIYEKCHRAELYLVHAVNEEEAWAYYLKETRGYLKQSDGTFYREEFHDDLEGVLSVYDLILDEYGEVTERSGVRHSTLQDAFRTYNVFPQQDGTYISRGIIFSGLTEALEKIFPDFCRFEIQEYILDEEKPCQLIFTSRDETEYLETLTCQHHRA